MPRSECVSLVAGVDEVRAVEDLRRDAYQRASEFDVLKSKAFEWTPADTEGYVLAVWDDRGSLLATMRGSVAWTRETAEEHFECDVALDDAEFPSLLLERGATRADSSLGGLNSLMRYYFLDAARRRNLHSVLGAVFDGAPRVRLLERLGYRFLTPSRTWDESLAARTSLIVVHLAQAALGPAMEMLTQLTEEVRSQFPWRGDSLDFRSR